RNTKDVDFSTATLRPDFDIDQFLAVLGESLANNTASLDTDIDCRIQGYEIRPARIDASFPTIRVRIGYAWRGTLQHKRLREKRSPSVIKLECSMNEEAIDQGPVILVKGTELPSENPGLADHQITRQVTRDRQAVDPRSGDPRMLGGRLPDAG
ncbi:MAG: hypothetical protein QGH45_20645, partial [Myxococcota bacterium]|nr:hypothetical protein [Myxococcota bacterium]